MHAQANKSMQFSQLRGAKAAIERQKALLSKELQATKNILDMRDAQLHHDQRHQQVPAHILWRSGLFSIAGIWI